MDSNLDEALKTVGLSMDATSTLFSNVILSKNPTQSYSARHRGTFFRPEYDFGDIRTAQDTDTFICKAVEKKSTKFLLSGFEFVGENPTTVEYIKKRLKQIEVASNKPFDLMMLGVAQDLFSISNHMWLFHRDANNSGGKPYKYKGKIYDPISAIFELPFETLEFKTKESGEFEKIKQVVPGSAKRPEWKAEDILFFYFNKRPGMAVGTPSLYPAIEDVMLLRRIEENVEELIESNLFPLFHYTIGTDAFPERVNPKTGLREVEQIAQTLKYMPSSGVYISDWRHKVEAIGSEGKALQIQDYLNYFRERVFAALGVSSVDMGIGDSSNRSTAQTQSRSLSESVEAVQLVMKSFIDRYLLIPLLLEGTFAFDPLKQEHIVEIKFGKIDVSEQMQIDTNSLSLFQGNAITHEEFRKRIGERPLKEESSLNYNKFPSIAEEAKLMMAKAGSGNSNVSANQYGKSPKKTTAKKDREIFNNDLLEIYRKFDGTNKDSVKELMTSRLVHLLSVNSPDLTIATNDGFEKLEDFISRTDVYLESFFQNLINKVQESNNDIDFSTARSICQWRIEKLNENISNFKDGQITIDKIYEDI